MLFDKKSRDEENYEDPATRYGRILRNKRESGRDRDDRPSLLKRLFGGGHDSDFVYYED